VLLSGPRTDITNKYGMLPIEASFIDDMDTILSEVLALNSEDPNLSVGKHNFERMVKIALDHSALKCLKVLLKALLPFDFSDIVFQKLLRREDDPTSLAIIDLLFLKLKPEPNECLLAALCARNKDDDNLFVKALEAFKSTTNV